MFTRGTFVIIRNYLIKVMNIKNYIKQHVLVVLVGLTSISFGTGIYVYNEYLRLKQDPSKVAQEEVNKLVAQVSKLIILPEGEVPTVATVADPARLKDQAFFAKAKTGDKVLVYTNAKKAILYNPESNKIVEVAPINIGTTTTPTPTLAPKLPAK